MPSVVILRSEAVLWGGGGGRGGLISDGGSLVIKSRCNFTATESELACILVRAYFMCA